jgi:hypothetical protein
MDEQLSADMPEQLSDVESNLTDETPEEEGEAFDAADETGATFVDPTLVEVTSAQFLSHWNRLVSTTNWEKGRLVSEWRLQLMGAGAPSHVYSDEAWSRRVGNVSSQHVGRLRRVYEQFGQNYQQYDGLFWSHFLAALDWEDAEMWLEGAVQNSWSVSQMRNSRWETLGGIPDQKPQDEEVAAEETDADAGPIEDVASAASVGSIGEVTDPEAEEAEETEASETDEAQDDAPFDSSESGDSEEPSATTSPVRPFENLPRLPDDLQEAFECFKLAILAHKLTNWQEIPRDAVLSTLDALKQLAVARSEE